MSSDFGFWKQSRGDAGEVFDSLAEGDTSDLIASLDVLSFRNELLANWPEIENVLEPSDLDLEEDPEDASKYVLLTLSVRQLGLLSSIVDMAKRYRLVGYSGVADEVL